ncbi:MAG: ribbon-helix-helix protein, CopG family [Oscillospiraceae bacterium]|nr:ribbon-helix-helix protein, CopG family [Oscillospiraceae bacterium]MBQ5748573.1 ribbon-helix-helix protein, CopG family [Oscillospiraceae bacterium]
MGIEKKTVSVRLDEDLIAKIRTLAEKENRSFSNLVETVLKKYADKQSEQK